MSRILTFFMILTTLLVISSCGANKTNSSSELENNQGYINAVLSTMNCGEVKTNEIDKEISNLEVAINSLEVTDSILRIQHQRKKSILSHISPKSLSEGIIRERLSTLKEEVEKIGIVKISFRERRTLQTTIKKIKIDYERWSFHQCHLKDLVDNKHEELNDYIELESYMCDEGCDSVLMVGNILSESEQRNKTVNVCSLYERKNKCRVQYDISKIYNNEKEHTNEVLRKAKQYFNQEVFGMVDSPLEIECVVAEKKELTIPIYQNENTVPLITAISEKWKRDDIEIKYKFGNSGLRLELVGTGLSRVSRDDLSTIYLNRNVTGVEIGKTIAHEFGHSLGFNDCYIEYFDTKREELVYYELERDKGNLMCSMQYGTNIPEKYLEKVVSKYCK